MQRRRPICISEMTFHKRANQSDNVDAQPRTSKIVGGGINVVSIAPNAPYLWTVVSDRSIPKAGSASEIRPQLDFARLCGIAKSLCHSNEAHGRNFLSVGGIGGRWKNVSDPESKTNGSDRVTECGASFCVPCRHL